MHELLSETKRGMAVLMARIVDRAGVSIAARDVAGVVYSIYKLVGDVPQVLAGHDAVPLNTDEVLFDTLQTGDEWSVDVCGYNFRHVIDFDALPQAAENEGRYVLVYEFASVSGTRSIIRFHLRGPCHD